MTFEVVSKRDDCLEVAFRVMSELAPKTKLPTAPVTYVSKETLTWELVCVLRSTVNHTHIDQLLAVL